MGIEVVSAKLIKRFTFAAAHYLPKHKGLCHQTHGHGWILNVCIKGIINKDTGMVIDYSDLKAVVQPIIDRFDHSFLNDWFENPTSENVAKYIYEYLYKSFKKMGCSLEYVDLWETETSHCIIEKGETIQLTEIQQLLVDSIKRERVGKRFRR